MKFVSDADTSAVAAFAPVAGRYVEIVQNQELVGLPLLKELRQGSGRSLHNGSPSSGPRSVS